MTRLTEVKRDGFMWFWPRWKILYSRIDQLSFSKIGDKRGYSRRAGNSSSGVSHCKAEGVKERNRHVGNTPRIAICFDVVKHLVSETNM